MSHRFAVSFSMDAVLAPDWERSAEESRIRRIEFSCGITPEPDKLEKAVARLDALQNRTSSRFVESIHIPFAPFQDWSLAAPEEALRKQGVRKILSFLRSCECLNAPDFTLHGSGEPLTEESRPAVKTALRRSLEELIPYFEEHRACVNVEILPRTCIGRTPEELAEVLTGLPEEHLGVCFDVNHLCHAPEKVPAGIELLGKRIRSLHLSDYDGIDECHWYPGDGVLNWTEIMCAVDALPRKALLIFETGGFVHAPEWQNRKIRSGIIFRNAERNAFYLEHASELEKRIAEERFS